MESILNKINQNNFETSEQHFIDRITGVLKLTAADTEGLYEEDSSHDEYIDNRIISLVDDYSRKNHISFEEADKIAEEIYLEVL